jgi:peptidoglycan L-alanyl-D-glutamate endopeptidase CwlK
MTISLEGLVPEFRTRALALLADLATRGIEMRPFAALRSPREQAILWRQSRAREEIESAAAKLRSKGAFFLAETLTSVGPQEGQHATNSLPGFSWHQWGEAIDCFWVINGVTEWSASRLVDGINGYRMYAASAKAADLHAGGNWSSFKVWPHLQARKAGSPVAEGLTVKQIDLEMKKRFG